MKCLSAFLLALFAALSASANAQANRIDPAILAAAHSVYIGDMNNELYVRDYEDLLAQAFTQTGRFTVLPTSRGADLILLLQIGTGQQPLTLVICNPHTLASLGSVHVTAPIFATADHEEGAATDLANAFFAIDPKRPTKPFLLKKTPGPKTTVRTFFSNDLSQNDPDRKLELKNGRAVSIYKGNNSLNADYKDLFADVQTSLETLGRFHFVSDIQEADLIFLIGGDVGCVESGDDPCYSTTAFLDLAVIDSRSLNPLASVTQNAYAKLGRSSPVIEHKAVAALVGSLQKQLKKAEK